MNDQMFRDLVALVLIATVLIICGTGHSVTPQIQEWADVAFGFLFGFKTAGYTIGKQSNATDTTTQTNGGTNVANDPK